MHILFVAVIMANILQADCRVYCKGANSFPWRPLGYSCPINCHNIVHAIERLRMIDYDNLLMSGTQNKQAPTDKAILTQAKLTNETHEQIMRKFNVFSGYGERHNLRDMFGEYLKILENRKAMSELQDTYQKAIAIATSKCFGTNKKFLAKPLLYNKLKKCQRRHNTEEDYFLKMFTQTLNKYATDIKFTVTMTRILLQKILGPNTDLRNGFLQVDKIIQFLREAIKRLEPEESKATITLRSKHCITLYVSGCFCKKGFVERSGQCVRPSKCPVDEIQRKFLSRVFV